MPSTSSKTDLMYEISYDPLFVPRQSPMANIKTVITDEKKIYIMKNHVTGAYFTLSSFAVEIWNLIDGKRTTMDIWKESMIKWRGIFKPSFIKQALLFFADKGALESVVEPVEKRRVKVASAFEVNVRVVYKSKEFLKSIHRKFRPLFRRPLLWVSLAFIAVCGIGFAGSFGAIFANKENFQIFGSSVVGFFYYTFVVLIPVIIIHEIAHGLALVHYGGSPGEMGTGLFYAQPMFYIDTTDAWTLSKSQRIMVFMAGNLSTLLIGSVIVVVNFLWQFPASISHTLSMAAFFCFYMSLMNLAPPFETDGYYVLIDLVNIPTLRQDAFDYLKIVIRRVLGKPVEEPEGLTGRKKKILLGYAVLSALWIAYMTFQTFTIMGYMTQDTAISVYNIFSAVLLSKVLSVATLVVGFVSVLYFAMTLVGYGLMLFVFVKKATMRALHFESIHDRDLAVFLYVPKQVSKSLVNKLKEKMQDVAEKSTSNFDVKRVGSLCIGVLRIGGTKLALVQIRQHLNEIDKKFRSVYKNFLDRYEGEIHESIGIYSHRKLPFTNLLREMTEEVAKTGRPEARALFEQIIKRQKKTAIYLLSSVFGTVWTIEIPPVQQKKVIEMLLPSLLIEDLAITDLYDEVEEFKKRVVYGYDSLARLSIENQETRQKTITHPQEYPIVSFFEPIRSRVIFVGKTEQIEDDLPALSPLLVCQVWCGYLDNVLTETIHALSSLQRAPTPSKEAIQKMKDGELTILTKNLKTFVANERLIHDSLDKSEERLRCAKRIFRELKKRLKPSLTFKIGLLDTIFAMNKENLKNLPRKLERFEEMFEEASLKVREIEELVRKEHLRRKPNFSKKKTRMLRAYPLVAIFSIALALAGLKVTTGLTSIPFLVAALLPQVFYWTLYFRTWRSFNSIGQYPSSTFDQIQLCVLALTEAVYKFLATEDILDPMEITAIYAPSNLDKNVKSNTKCHG